MIRSSNARLHRNASVCCAATVTALSRLTNASLLFTARSCSVQFLGTSLFIQRCTGCLPSVAVHDLGVLSSHYESNGHDSAGQGRAGQGEGDSNQLQIRSDCWGGCRRVVASAEVRGHTSEHCLSLTGGADAALRFRLFPRVVERSREIWLRSGRVSLESAISPLRARRRCTPRL